MAATPATNCTPALSGACARTRAASACALAQSERLSAATACAYSSAAVVMARACGTGRAMRRRRAEARTEYTEPGTASQSPGRFPVRTGRADPLHRVALLAQLLHHAVVAEQVQRTDDHQGEIGRAIGRASSRERVCTYV